MSWQKKTQSEKEAQGGKIIEKPNDYGIDAEIGRLEVPTFEIKKGSEKVFSTEGNVFPETGSREHFRTVCFRELAVFSPCEESYRKSAQMLNRALRRKEGQQVQARTIANLVEREGEAIAVCVENKAKTILKCHNFTEAGVPKGETSAYSLLGHESDLFKERVTQAGKELNDILSKERQIDVESLQGTFEDPTQVKALISVDDVRMSRNRKPLAGKEDRPLQKRKNG